MVKDIYVRMKTTQTQKHCKMAAYSYDTAVAEFSQLLPTK